MRRGSRRGTRRRGAALVLGAVLATAPLGCAEDEPPAVKVARKFARAVRNGDVEPVLTLVDAQTVARVGQAAERASDQVGGRRNVEPSEMLQVVDVDPRFQVAEAELLEGDDQRAVVRLTGADGSSHSLELINEDGSWRVRLPLPPGPAGET